MTGPVTVVMVSIGGYGHFSLKILLEELPKGKVELAGAVDPAAKKAELYRELKTLGIPIFDSLRDFYDSGLSAELAVISSPIHYHVPQSCLALERGSHVLCDKPVGATIQEAVDLIRACETSGKWVSIGYQWSFSSAIQALKRDIIRGRFGKPLRLKTLCFWPRGEAYYRRNDWAGKKRDDGGRWVLDSPANNAMAHFLHNLFYVLGDEAGTSAAPKSVAAELYRAYRIENFDSVACRIFTLDGTELLFYASHTTSVEQGPMFEFEFEKAVISYGDPAERIMAVDRTGSRKSYGSPEDSHQFRKLFVAMEAARDPGAEICGPEAAVSQTLCVNGIQESVPEVPFFPESLIHRSEDGSRLWVEGLGEALYDCYRGWILPSEAGFPWASLGKTIDLEDYEFFPGGRRTMETS